jgi:hypothetical protein
MGLDRSAKTIFPLVNSFYSVEFDGCESNMVTAYMEGTACPPPTKVCNWWWNRNGVCFKDAVILDLMIGIYGSQTKAKPVNAG